MARTKQTERKSTGGLTPNTALAKKLAKKHDATLGSVYKKLKLKPQTEDAAHNSALEKTIVQMQELGFISADIDRESRSQYNTIVRRVTASTALYFGIDDSFFKKFIGVYLFLNAPKNDTFLFFLVESDVLDTVAAVVDAQTNTKNGTYLASCLNFQYAIHLVDTKLVTTIARFYQVFMSLLKVTHAYSFDHERKTLALRNSLKWQLILSTVADVCVQLEVMAPSFRSLEPDILAYIAELKEMLQTMQTNKQANSQSHFVYMQRRIGEMMQAADAQRYYTPKTAAINDVSDSET